MSRVSLYVAVLTWSRIIFADPFRDKNVFSSLIDGLYNAFQYLAGVPKTIIPDNLNSGVNRPDFYETDLNRTY